MPRFIISRRSFNEILPKLPRPESYFTRENIIVSAVPVADA